MLSQKPSWIRSWLGIVSNRDLYMQGIQIMATIKDYTDQVNARFDELDTSVDALKKNSTGIADDVAYLKETIEKINNNPGPITPEDQALLDASLARLSSLANRVREHKTSLDTLDTATTRPVTPPVEPGEDEPLTPEGRARAASQTRTATSNTPGAAGYPKTYVVPPASGVTPPASAASRIPPSENVEARPEQTGGQASPAKANPNTPKANVPVNPAQNTTGKPSAKPMP